MRKFNVGDECTYYPRQHADDNVHWPARVLSASSKRVTILYHANGRPHIARVHPSRLMRQRELRLVAS